MSTDPLQLTLGLDVAEPAWIPAAQLRPGDVVQTRDHSGAKLWTSRVLAVRIRWRATRAAWPVPGLVLRYDRRVQVLTDHPGPEGRDRLIRSCAIEVTSRGPKRRAPQPRRLRARWTRPTPAGARP